MTVISLSLSDVVSFNSENERLLSFARPRTILVKIFVTQNGYCCPVKARYIEAVLDWIDEKEWSIQFQTSVVFDPKRIASRFSFGCKSPMVPNHRSPLRDELTVPENLDSPMQLLFMACLGVEDLLKEGIDENSIDLDGRTALHIAACEGHIDVVKLLLSRKANIDARDWWGSTAAVDAKHYGNVKIYNILTARGAKVLKNRKTPMFVSNPKEVLEYELNSSELRRSDGISKVIAAAEVIYDLVDPSANLIFGAVIDLSLGGQYEKLPVSASFCQYINIPIM